ncbi:glycosyltransferase [Litoreibacter sp.]
MANIVFAGGGSSGHALPSLRVANFMRDLGHTVTFIGSHASIEEKLCTHYDIPFHAVATGKFNRTRKMSAISAAGKTLLGVRETRKLMRKLRPDGVFSSGGFASVPVILAARMCGVTNIIIHACDLSIGLANRVCLPFATHLTCTFTETVNQYKKAVASGPIMPPELNGPIDPPKNEKPLLLVYGGGQGAVAINEKLRADLPTILPNFNVFHVCGQGKTDSKFDGTAGYEQHEYVMNLTNQIKQADVAICRAGSNSLWELILTGTPHLAIPLPLSVSRGDQIENCKYFDRLGVTQWLQQDVFIASDLNAELIGILEHTADIRRCMDKIKPACPATETIKNILLT